MEPLIDHTMPKINFRVHSQLIKKGIQKTPEFIEIRAIRDRIKYLRLDAQTYADLLYSLDQERSIIEMVKFDKTYKKQEYNELYDIYLNLVKEINQLIKEYVTKQELLYQSDVVKKRFQTVKAEEQDAIDRYNMMCEVERQIQASTNLAVIQEKIERKINTWFNSPHLNSTIIKSYNMLMRLSKSLMSDSIAKSTIQKIYNKVKEDRENFSILEANQDKEQ